MHRCWELIEKYDPDMFNNDSPYPDERPTRQESGRETVLGPTSIAI